MSQPSIGTVSLVGAGPGDPGLLTLRGRDLLARAQVVIHDALLDPTLLSLAPASAEIILAGKRGNHHVLTQAEIHQLLVQHARAGRHVVRLKGGDPFIFGRGGEEAQHLATAGIPFEIVPGVSSFSAVPATAGIPLTHRGYASAFTVITGHEDPTKPDPSLDWRQIAQTHGTKVILMGAERLAAIAQALIDGGLPASTPAAFIEWGTTPRQRTLTATLDSIADRVRSAGLGAPAIAVIGEVVQLRDQIAWFEKRPLFGQRIVVTRTRAQSGELTTRFAELGADVVSLPTLRIAPPTQKEPLLEALTGLGEYDWIIFSSANGVTAFFDALLAAYDDIRALGNTRLAAVGPATAAQLRQRHLRVDAQPTEFLGSHIADAIAAQESLENTRLLVARAEIANPDLVRELEDRGAIVDDVGFYRTEPEPLSPDGPLKTLRDHGADWIVFTSSSTALNLHAACPLPELRQQHPRLRFASIGPETSRTLVSLGAKPDVQARQSTLDDLVHAVTAAPRLKPS